MKSILCVLSLPVCSNQCVREILKRASLSQLVASYNLATKRYPIFLSVSQEDCSRGLVVVSEVIKETTTSLVSSAPKTILCGCCCVFCERRVLMLLAPLERMWSSVNHLHFIVP